MRLVHFNNMFHHNKITQTLIHTFYMYNIVHVCFGKLYMYFCLCMLYCVLQYGRYPLDLAGYEQIFANFLLGKTPYGPGRFIFGCFEHSPHHTKFKLIRGTDDDEEEIKINVEKKGRRGSTEAVRLRLKKV